MPPRRDLEDVRRVLRNLGYVQPPTPEEVDQQRRARSLWSFMKVEPPTFAGTSEPVEAEDWLKHIKRLHRAVTTPAEYRVDFAAHCLIGEAGNWWTSIVAQMNVNCLTWEQFEELFYERYFSLVLRDQKMAEFLNLSQGVMSVHEYVAKQSGKWST